MSVVFTIVKYWFIGAIAIGLFLLPFVVAYLVAGDAGITGLVTIVLWSIIAVVLGAAIKETVFNK